MEQKNKNEFEPVDREKQWMLNAFRENPLELYPLVDGLFEPRFSIGQVGINRQEIQFWEEKELISLNESTTEKREWRKVNFFDLIWLKIIDEMRKFGVNVETIKTIKDTLFSKLDDKIIDMIVTMIADEPGFKKVAALMGDKDFKEFYTNLPQIKSLLKDELNFFILMVIGLLDLNNPTYIITLPDGNFELYVVTPENPELYNIEKYFLLGKSYHVIYLNHLLDEFFLSPKIKEEDWQRLFKLTKAEKQIVQLLRKENIKELRVKFNLSNKKGTLMVEVVQTGNLEKMKNKLNGILEKGKFKQIKIQTENNKLVFVEETTKIKIDND
jgi:DNA-binding transcriptional MerR regulator